MAVSPRDRKEALAAHLEEDDLEFYGTTDGFVETNFGDYWVVTYEEAYKLAKNYLVEGLEDFYYDKITPLKEITLDLRKYVNKESWAEDILKQYPDEIALSLASYDHEEHSVGEFWIYRVN